jgi:hypothetical protein
MPLVNTARVAALLRELADELDGPAGYEAPRPAPPPPEPARHRRLPIQRPPPAVKPDEITAARARRGLRKIGYRAGDAGDE